jgi:hypothetical protein
MITSSDIALSPTSTAFQFVPADGLVRSNYRIPEELSLLDPGGRCLCLIPEGSRPLAGGHRASDAHRKTVLMKTSIPAGMPAKFPWRRGWHPSGVLILFEERFPVGEAALRPPANGWNPSGIRFGLPGWKC